MARPTTLVALFVALFLTGGCGAPADDDDDSSPACEVTDTVTGGWWEVWLEACGTSATVYVETDSVDGSASESGKIYFEQTCSGASSKEWNSALLAPSGYPALEVDALLLYNAIEFDVTDNIENFYDGASESFYDACPTPAPRVSPP